MQESNDCFGGGEVLTNSCTNLGEEHIIENHGNHPIFKHLSEVWSPKMMRKQGSQPAAPPVVEMRDACLN